MSRDLSKEAPNVVTETQFKDLLQQGYQAEVVCQEEAYRKKAVWYGRWIIRAVNSDRSFEKPLVPKRTREDEVRFRIFKTTNGLISFLQEHGFEPIHIPLQKGGRTIHALQNGTYKPDDG